VIACHVADLLDLLAGRRGHPSQRGLARCVGLSQASISRASRLPPEERQKVRVGQRPLVFPSVKPKPVPAPATPPTVPTTLDVDQRLLDLVAELGGVNATLDVLAAAEARRIAV
jgi:hypothetical protein